MALCYLVSLFCANTGWGYTRLTGHDKQQEKEKGFHLFHCASFITAFFLKQDAKLSPFVIGMSKLKGSVAGWHSGMARVWFWLSGRPLLLFSLYFLIWLWPHGFKSGIMKPSYEAYFSPSCVSPYLLYFKTAVSHCDLCWGSTIRPKSSCAVLLKPKSVINDIVVYVLDTSLAGLTWCVRLCRQRVFYSCIYTFQISKLCIFPHIIV